MQNSLATVRMFFVQARQPFQNGHILGQFHLPPHGRKVQSRIDQRAVKIENNAFNHWLNIGLTANRKKVAIAIETAC